MPDNRRRTTASSSSRATGSTRGSSVRSSAASRRNARSSVNAATGRSSASKGNASSRPRNSYYSSRAMGSAQRQKTAARKPPTGVYANPSFQQGNPTGKAKKNASGSASGFLSSHRPFVIVVGVLLLIVLAFVLDGLFTSGKIYQGVKIGQVDVGGMTQEQAVAAVQQAYGYQVMDGQIVIYAGEQGKAAGASSSGSANADDISVQEYAESVYSWTYSASELGLWLPAEEWAQAAYSWGRDSFLDRLSATFFGKTVPATLGIDQNQLEHAASLVDDALGTPRVDWGISVTDGVASVTDGHDGLTVNRTTLLDQISSAVLSSEGDTVEVVASVEEDPVRITEKQATAAAETTNKALADGADFTYKQTSWHADAATLGNWVYTKAKQVSDNSYELALGVDESLVRSALLPRVSDDVDMSQIHVTFEHEGKGILVHPTGEGTMPDVSGAASQLNVALFGSESQSADAGALEADGKGVAITFGEMDLPETMTFDDALTSGIIECISTFTTEYTNTAYTVARNTNIHLAAEEINNVITSPGEEWSYNDIAGDSTEEEGFMAAGTIIDGVYSESIGGGLCQVATTVFNCIYNSGFTITERHNHSLYISSYPIGRDAAISYGSMDLRWRNDSDSDVVLLMTYTDESVTASLYGIGLGYSVTTDVGDWEDGDKYKIVAQEDESLPEGYSYVYQKGVDGSEISVVRTVRDSDGNVVSTKTFRSVYDPQNEVIKHGPNTEVDTKRDDVDEDDEENSSSNTSRRN